MGIIQATPSFSYVFQDVWCSNIYCSLWLYDGTKRPDRLIVSFIPINLSFIFVPHILGGACWCELTWLRLTYEAAFEYTYVLKGAEVQAYSGHSYDSRSTYDVWSMMMMMACLSVATGLVDYPQCITFFGSATVWATLQFSGNPSKQFTSVVDHNTISLLLSLSSSPGYLNKSSSIADNDIVLSLSSSLMLAPAACSSFSVVE